MTSYTKDELMLMTRYELVQLGRFTLRLSAKQLGLTDTKEATDSFMAMSNEVQADTMFRFLHTPSQPFHRDWANQSWVAELFLENPNLVSLAEKHDAPAGFNFKFIVGVVLDSGEELYHLLESVSFDKEQITSMLGALFEDPTLRGSRWLNTMPTSDIRLIVNREKLNIGPTESSPRPGTPEDYELEFHEVMRVHGGWMLAAMKAWPKLSMFGRRLDTRVSPNTFLLQMDSIETGNFSITWMKYPSAEKINRRIKAERNRWKSLTGTEYNECRLLIPREAVFKHFGVADPVELANAESRLHARSEVSKRYADSVETVVVAKRDKYAEARERLTQKLIANGHVVDDPEREVAAAMVKEDKTVDLWEPGFSFERKLAAGLRSERDYLRKKAASKHDPRPGIDDQGEGFYSPTWED